MSEVALSEIGPTATELKNDDLLLVSLKNDDDDYISKKIEMLTFKNGVKELLTDDFIPMADSTKRTITASGTETFSSITITEDGKLNCTTKNLTVTNANIPAATTADIGGIKLKNNKTTVSDANISNSNNNFDVKLNANSRAYVNIPKADNNNFGLIKLNSAPDSTETSISGKNYPVKTTKSGKAYVNVPWTNTTYSLATKISDGLVRLLNNKSGSVTLAATTETGRNYPVQMRNDGVIYVNVPWTNTTYSLATKISDGLVRLLNNKSGSVTLAATTETGRNYPVQMRSDGVIYVNVPWTDNNTTYSLANGDTQGLIRYTTGKYSNLNKTDIISLSIASDDKSNYTFYPLILTNDSYPCIAIENTEPIVNILHEYLSDVIEVSNIDLLNPPAEHLDKKITIYSKSSTPAVDITRLFEKFQRIEYESGDIVYKIRTKNINGVNYNTYIKDSVIDYPDILDLNTIEIKIHLLLTSDDNGGYSLDPMPTSVTNSSFKISAKSCEDKYIIATMIDIKGKPYSGGTVMLSMLKTTPIESCGLLLTPNVSLTAGKYTVRVVVSVSNISYTTCKLCMRLIKNGSIRYLYASEEKDDTGKTYYNITSRTNKYNFYYDGEEDSTLVGYKDIDIGYRNENQYTMTCNTQLTFKTTTNVSICIDSIREANKQFNLKINSFKIWISKAD